MLILSVDRSDVIVDWSNLSILLKICRTVFGESEQK